MGTAYDVYREAGTDALLGWSGAGGSCVGEDVADRKRKKDRNPKWMYPVFPQGVQKKRAPFLPGVGISGVRVPAVFQSLIEKRAAAIRAKVADKRMVQLPALMQRLQTGKRKISPFAVSKGFVRGAGGQFSARSGIDFYPYLGGSAEEAATEMIRSAAEGAASGGYAGAAGGLMTSLMPGEEEDVASGVATAFDPMTQWWAMGPEGRKAVKKSLKTRRGWVSGKQAAKLGIVKPSAAPGAAGSKVSTVGLGGASVPGETFGMSNQTLMLLGGAALLVWYLTKKKS